MKNILLLLLVFIIVSGLSGCGKNSTKDTTAKEDKNTTSIYLVSMPKTESDEPRDIFMNDCNNDEFVEVKIDKKLSPQEALETLFKYKTSDGRDDLYNAFNVSDNLKIEKMLVQNDFAIVTLSKDLVAKNMCDESRIRAQITKTLLQFENIDGVDIFVGDDELSSYISTINKDKPVL